MRSQRADGADDHGDSGQRGTALADARLYLRSAREDDRDFLFRVFESTRAEEFARLGWGPERVAALLAEQFSMQDMYYRRHYPHGRFDVVMLGETAIGRFYHYWHGSEARLIDIALLPAHRGAGIGTRLVRDFVARAADKAMPAVLYVEMNNPVQALYRMLGFETVGENGVYHQMRRPAMPFADERVQPVEGLALDGGSNTQ
ncbi:GNAT family N-acetyltransferase [Trinickia dinghuensis]|uniref:GNAT family N-acetyltransferase n=1 Tax=Trinickia dinghuensis TaxID=2291023 RepID=A0A3D8JPW4_9BURK|nr:GNAT family N-acetyltransferase [Trinickia dinghuensis]RDU95057.1 GNAT family N-acetyltransferase [Trinickia dinghuensis]